MQRVFHPYHVWEDYIFGMWRKVSVRENELFIDRAIEFTIDTELWGKYMIWAVHVWPFGCEHNLTCTEMNRRAWLGQAAVCVAFNCPEYTTRLAWHQLTQTQQEAANLKADEAIKIWEENYAKDKDWNRCIDSRQTPDFMDVRHLREGLPIFQRGEGQYGYASFGGRRGSEKEKKIRSIAHRPRGTVQIDDRSCPRLF